MAANSGGKGQGKGPDEGQGHLVQLLYEMEMAAEDILTDKQQMIDLDKKRQQTREAVR